MSIENSKDKAARALAHLLLNRRNRPGPDNYGDQDETIYLRKRRGRPIAKVEFCPYIGIGGTKVDLHTTKLFPAYDHVGVKPRQSLGTISTGGGGGD